MTKRQAVKEFNQIWKNVLEFYPDYKNDKPAKRYEANCFIDELHRSGRITDKQRNTWVIGQ